MHGFQLWANLPASLKMTDPRYQDIPAAAIPEVTEDDGSKARDHLRRVLGQEEGRSRAWPPTRVMWTSLFRRASANASRWRPRATPLPMSLPARGRFRDASEPQAVLTESAVDPNAAPVYDAKNHSLVLFDRGDEIVVQAGPEGIRFLLVSGKPLEEPVAWYGPIVMNTEAELRQAMSELQKGRSSGTSKLIQ